MKASAYDSAATPLNPLSLITVSTPSGGSYRTEKTTLQDLLASSGQESALVLTQSDFDFLGRVNPIGTAQGTLSFPNNGGGTLLVKFYIAGKVGNEKLVSVVQGTPSSGNASAVATSEGITVTRTAGATLTQVVQAINALDGQFVASVGSGSGNATGGTGQFVLSGGTYAVGTIAVYDDGTVHGQYPNGFSGKIYICSVSGEWMNLIVEIESKVNSIGSNIIGEDRDEFRDNIRSSRTYVRNYYQRSVSASAFVSPVSSVWSDLGTKSSRSIIFANNPTNADTLIIYDLDGQYTPEIWTFVSSDADPSNFSVLIGGTAADTVIALEQAINQYSKFVTGAHDSDQLIMFDRLSEGDILSCTTTNPSAITGTGDFVDGATGTGDELPDSKFFFGAANSVVFEGKDVKWSLEIVNDSRLSSIMILADSTVSQQETGNGEIRLQVICDTSAYATVSDFATAIVVAASDPNTPPKIYNIASALALSFDSNYSGTSLPSFGFIRGILSGGGSALVGDRVYYEDTGLSMIRADDGTGGVTWVEEFATKNNGVVHWGGTTGIKDGIDQLGNENEVDRLRLTEVNGTEMVRYRLVSQFVPNLSSQYPVLVESAQTGYVWSMENPFGKRLGKAITIGATTSDVFADNGLGAPLKLDAGNDERGLRVTGFVQAREPATNLTKTWEFSALAKKTATPGSTALVGSSTVTGTEADAGAAAWALTVTADTANDAIAITVSGEAAKSITWTVEVDLHRIY